MVFNVTIIKTIETNAYIKADNAEDAEEYIRHKIDDGQITSLDGDGCIEVVAKDELCTDNVIIDYDIEGKWSTQIGRSIHE